MKLTRAVVVTNPATGQDVALLPGRVVPAWAEALLNDKYDDLTVAELRDEIRSRNEGRDDAEHLSAEGRKAELIQTLKADDQP